MPLPGGDRNKNAEEERIYMKTLQRMTSKNQPTSKTQIDPPGKPLASIADEGWSVTVEGPKGGIRGDSATLISCSEDNRGGRRHPLCKRDRRDLTNALTRLQAAVAAVKDALGKRKPMKYPNVSIVTMERNEFVIGPRDAEVTDFSAAN